MQATNGVMLPGDIGGPMSISNGLPLERSRGHLRLRPIISGLFGSNGVAAVEGALISSFFAAPLLTFAPANFPLYSQRMNFTAESQSLCDLKSETLSLLLEQMGLADPIRYIYVLRQWNPAFTNFFLLDSSIYVFRMCFGLMEQSPRTSTVEFSIR